MITYQNFVRDEDADFLTLAQIKAHVAVVHSEDDAMLTQLGKSAISHLSNILNVVVERHNIDAKVERQCSPVHLTYKPIQEVSKVFTRNDAGNEVTVSASEYTVEFTGRSKYAIVRFKDHRYIDEIYIRFKAGYLQSGVDIAALQQAALLLIGSGYEAREKEIVGTIVAQNPSFRALINPYRRLA